MTQPARHFAEPEERDDPRNAVLDLIDAALRTALDHGLEAPMRARLAALLPPPRAEREPGPAAPISADDEIRAVAVVRACDRFSKNKASALEHEGAALIKHQAQAILAAAKKARGA